jgi:hypothetical protein
MNINPFKTDAAKRLERDLDTARAARIKLAERLSAAESAVIEKRSEAQRLARDGADNAALDLAEAAHRGAQDRVVTLAAALAETTELVGALERSVADLADGKLRTETAAAIEKMAEEMEEAAAMFDTGAARLAETTQRAAVIIPDVHGLRAFAMIARAEIPVAVEMVAGILRDRAGATLAGTAPAALPKPESPPAAKTLPPPKTERVFVLRNVRWREGEGVRVARRYTDIDLPIELARRGLRSEAACAIADPRRKKFAAMGSVKVGLPSAEDCEALDNDAESIEAKPTAAEPVKHSAFERVDRGPAYTIKAPREATS